MASGVNTTFRQIGIATGIAAYGSIFAASMQHKLDRRWRASRRSTGTSRSWSAQSNAGQRGPGHRATPTQLRGTVVRAIESSFTSSLDILLVASAVLALAGAVCALTLIRTRDFVASHPQPSQAQTDARAPVPAGRAG